MVLALGITMTIVSASLPPGVSADDDVLPKVQLNADNIAPRPIEDRTSEVVPRDYAHAWQNMAQALDQNRADLLDGYFTGFAKDNLSKLIADQKRTGIHVRYVDHGHKLDALFYAPAGDAMQLRDRAQLEVQILDGGKLIHSEQLTQTYLVLMTPGADRWLVRDLETTEAAR
jgi:hypothetical protein